MQGTPVVSLRLQNKGSRILTLSGVGSTDQVVAQVSLFILVSWFSLSAVAGYAPQPLGVLGREYYFYLPTPRQAGASLH